jgi:DNA modification methylase
MPSKVADLKAADYNPRKISKAQLDALGRAMREFGDLGGVVVNRRTGNVVGGHQRIKQLSPETKIHAEKVTGDSTGTTARGWIETPFGRFDYREVDWPLAKEKAANLAANKHGGEFDMEAVAGILGELEGAGLDLDLTGFLEQERIALIPVSLVAGATDGGDAPAPLVQPKSCIGDIYRLGNHHLLCGDASNSDTMTRLMGGVAADLLFSDPPYGISYGAKNRMLNSFQKAGRNLADIKNDSLPKGDLYKLLVTAFSNARKAMSDVASFYITAPQGGELGMMMMMIDAGLPTRHVLNWVKNAPTFSMGRLDYDYQHEPILYGWKKTHKFYGKGPHTKSAWFVDRPRESKEHPTMKPVALMVNAILNSTKAKDIVLDPFGGSGSTLIAAEMTGRSCRMMELEPKYIDVIVARWERFAGRKAELVRADKKTVARK